MEPTGIVFSPQGLLYSSEHGAGTDDEVNLVEKSSGWPQVEGFCDQPDETTPCQELEVKEPSRLGRPPWPHVGWSISTMVPYQNGNTACCWCF